MVTVEPALYREFVDLGSDRKKILNFAERYGTLGLKEGEGLQLSSDGTPGEIFSAWRDQIKMLKAAVDLWENISLAQAGDKDARAKLQARFRWSMPNEPKSITYHDIDSGPLSTGNLGEPLYLGSNFATEYFPAPWDALEDDPVIRPAVYYLEQELIGKHGTLVPRIKWAVAPNVLRQFRVLRDEAPKLALHPLTQGLFFHPESLLAGLWLQFAWAVTAEHRHRRCEICKRLMLVSIGGEGARRTCSGRCRMRLSLRRTAAARAIAKGESREEVSAKFRITESELDEWLARRRDGKRKKTVKTNTASAQRSA